MSKDKTGPRPTYREALEAIGHYLDEQLYRGIFVAESEDGYVGKARRRQDGAELHAEGLSFPRADVQALIEQNTGIPPTIDDAPPLCPDGYGAFMAAVGALCDRENGSFVSVLEVDNGFVVGLTVTDARGRAAERKRLVLDRAGVDDLLTAAGL